MNELRAAGLGSPAPFRSFAKFGALLACALGLFWLASRADVALAWRAASITLGCWLLAGAAMCGHDGAHSAASHRPWVNTLLANLGFTLLGGLSVMYWRQKHNSLHHPNVNVATKDPDVQQGLLALSSRQHASHGALVQWLQRNVQAAVFWLVGAPLVLLDLKVTSIWYVAKELAAGRHIRAHLLDVAWLALHHAVWLGIPLWFLPVKTALVGYALVNVIPGFFLTFIFAPAHIPYPLVERSEDPLRLQLASTRNFRTNWFFRFTLIGLDHQVEHHVAPMMSHFELEAAAPIVRAYCERHGLPYNETSWGRALLDTHIQVRDGWRIGEVVV